MNSIFWSGRKRRCFQPMGNRNEPWRKVWNEIVFRRPIQSIWDLKKEIFFIFFQESDFLKMSELNSEVIGGRSLRNRKSLAAKNKGNSLIGIPYKFKILESPATPIKKEVAFGSSFVSPISRTRSNTRAVRTTRSSRAATRDGF